MALLQERTKRGVVIDSGLLLLLLLGNIRPDFVGRHKRLEKYEPQDLKLLNHIVQQFDIVVTTPQILTEVSNLASGLKGDLKTRFSQTLKEYINRAIEEYRRAGVISSESEFFRLGFGDAASLVIGGAYQLLTDDFPLAQIAHSRGQAVINFNHLRHA